MNTLIGFKPTVKKSRLALILQSQYDTPCYYCGGESIRVGAFWPITGKKNQFEIRHLCERHKRFGIWTDSDTAWGWS